MRKIFLTWTLGPNSGRKELDSRIFPIFSRGLSLYASRVSSRCRRVVSRDLPHSAIKLSLGRSAQCAVEALG